MLVYISLIMINDVAIGSSTHKAHNHGVANLMVAFESNNLEVQFESPAMSLLGFEHSPKTEQQMEIIESTKAKLKSPENLLSIKGADCQFNSANVSIDGPAGKSLSHNDKQDITQQHKDHHDDHHSNQEHSEVSAVYKFDCDDTEKIQSLSVSLFDSFPSIEEIKVTWLSDTQQSQDVLRPDKATINLR